MCSVPSLRLNMRAPILIFIAIYFASVCKVCKGQVPMHIPQDCVTTDLKDAYWNSIYNLLVPVYKQIAVYSNCHFIFSPCSVWLTLAAIAEGSDNATKQQLFKMMNLPDDMCVRQKLYEIATSRTNTVKDVDIVSTRALVIDEGVTINPSWLNFVTKNYLLDVVTSPIKSNPVKTRNEIERIMRGNVPRLNLTGNSVLVDTTDYNGLWTTAFADAVIERSPFYSQTGKEIGSVDLMKVKRRTRMGYIESLNGKVVELPVGPNSEYRMLILMILDSKDFSHVIGNMKNEIIIEMSSSLTESKVPIEIAVPRMEVTGEIDMGAVLKVFGFGNLWTDPDATKYVSTPSALPSSYLHRATMVLDKHGITKSLPEQDPPPGTPTGLDPRAGVDFIANKPFMIGLFDAETFTPLYGLSYTKPTYPHVDN